jgi:hypothetical protein
VTDGDFLNSKTGSMHELNYPRKRAILRIPEGTPRTHMNPGSAYDLGCQAEFYAPGSDAQTVTELVRIDTQGDAEAPVRIPEDFTLVTELEQAPAGDRSK